MTLRIKAKVRRSPNIKVKVLPRFPARVIAGDGITIVQAGGSYTISVDFDNSAIVSGPVLSTDNAVPRFDGTDGTVLQNSNVTISDAGVMTVNANAASLPTPATGTVLHVGGADGGNTRTSIASFGTSTVPVVTFHKSRGTAAVPTAAQSSDELGGLTWNAYGASAYATSGRAVFQALATENWTDSAQGAKFQFRTTPAGGTSTATVLTVGDGGTVTITPTASTYTNALSTTQTGPGGSVSGPKFYNVIDVTHIGEVASTGVVDNFGLSSHQAAAFKVNMTVGPGALPTLTSAVVFSVRDICSGAAQNELIGGNFTLYSTADTPLSNIYGGVSYVVLDEAGNKGRIVGHELDVGVATTATISERIGLGITSQALIKTAVIGRQGSTLDTAIAVYNASDNAAAWQNLIELDNHGGYNPLHTTGSWFSSRAAYTVANFANLSNLTVTGDILLFPHVRLTGSGVLQLNQTNSAMPSPLSASIAHLVNEGVAYLSLDAIGTTKESAIVLRSANGTAAAPSASQSNDLLGAIVSMGYGASAYGSATSGAAIFTFANQTWTGSAQGTRMSFYTTANGSTTKAIRLTIENDGAHTITSSSANTIAAGRQGSTNPVLQVDASTASVATGLKIKGAAAAGGLALSVITSGTNENLTVDAAGSGTITLGGTSTGAITLTRATTMSAALTYGGVTLSNSVQGTGSMVLSTNAALTTPNIGTPSAGVLTNCTGLPYSALVSAIYGTFYKGSNQAYTATAAAKVLIDTAETSQGLTFDGVTNNRVTIITAGRYLVMFSVYVFGLTTGGDEITGRIKKNGTTDLVIGIVAAVTNPSKEGAAVGSKVVSLAANDYLEIYATAQTNGTVGGIASLTYMSLQYIGP